MTSTSTHDLDEQAYQNFLTAYPSYTSTIALDDLRCKEYGRLDKHKHIYLDYTGGGLYAASQVTAHTQLLHEQVFGNPHSHNPTSSAMTALVEEAREAVLLYFKADPAIYTVIFTSNASGALKLVGEAYPFGPDSHYLLTFDNHNSVNGIREFARQCGATTTYVPLDLPEMRVDEARLIDYLSASPGNGDRLFAFPAHSNFSGVQHPLEWIPLAQAHGWDVILDAAAFVPTNPLDLSRYQPDFVPISFYKMLGYPTGIGCLIARNQALTKLTRPWFAGGTTTLVSVQNDQYDFRSSGEAFEDGTLNYLSLPAIPIGLAYLDKIGMETIHERVQCLIGWLIDELLGLHHGNGQPMVRLYGPPGTAHRGGTITVNFHEETGEVIDHFLVEQKASAEQISLRTGTFCNPGGGEMALSLDKTDLILCGQPSPQLTMDDIRLAIDRKSLGAVRISVGLVSNFEDVYHFATFVKNMCKSHSER